jgi:hypothetical protein
MISGYYVNNKNISTLFKSGSVTASTNGGFRLANQDIGYESKPSGPITVQQTFFRKMNKDLNDIYKDINTGGLSFNIYSGYFADVVTYDTGKTPTNSGTGITDFTNISTATNDVMPVDGGDNYTVVWTGTFLSDFTGDWTFGLKSDDASYMWIGEYATTGYTTANSTINNGGTHSMTLKTATISLISGQSYPIRIIFGEIGGGDDCQLYFVQTIIEEENGEVVGEYTINNYNFTGKFI